jgi:transcriptional regulator with XRE-family HTH domain
MEEIKRLRKARGLSQAKLAALADLDPSTVSQIETGARRANMRTLERLATALGAEVGDLFPLGQAPLPDLEDERRDPYLDVWIRHLERRAAAWDKLVQKADSKIFRDVGAALEYNAHVQREAWALIKGTVDLVPGPDETVRAALSAAVWEMNAAAERTDKKADAALEDPAALGREAEAMLKAQAEQEHAAQERRKAFGVIQGDVSA